jgi:anti-sigma-K factor RskA
VRSQQRPLQPQFEQRAHLVSDVARWRWCCVVNGIVAVHGVVIAACRSSPCTTSGLGSAVAGTRRTAWLRRFAATRHSSCTRCDASAS